MKKIVPPSLLIIFFLIIKVINNSVHLSDTNTYFNNAYQISHGRILYKDFFFSDFPLFSYVASLYYFLTGGNIRLFYFTSSIEVSIITLLIYLITYKKTKDYLISTISSILYVFSFMVLSVSDHQTGVFTASLFATLSYFFFQEKKHLISGIFIALAILTKAYFLPIFFSFFIYIAIKKDWNNLLKFVISFVLTGLIIMLPFLIQTPRQFISDILFSLNRPVGLSKINVMWFFITKDFPFFILLIFNLLNIKRNGIFGLVSIFSILFIFIYQDIYYLYLNFLMPFLCISLYELTYFFNNKFKLQRLVIPTIIFVFILLNLFTYISNFINFEKLENIDEIIQTIKVQNPDFLYGASTITPALSAITNIPAFENINEAHEYFFIRNVYDKKLLTDKAVRSRTIIITQGANYPEYNIRQDILDNIFVKETIYENCKIILSIPVYTEGNTNRINLFKCY